MYLSNGFKAKKALQIEPIREFCLNGAVARLPVGGIIIVNINQKEIRYGRKTPLKAGIDVHVFKLTIVLQKSSQKYRL